MHYSVAAVCTSYFKQLSNQNITLHTLTVCINSHGYDHDTVIAYIAVQLSLSINTESTTIAVLTPIHIEALH